MDNYETVISTKNMGVGDLVVCQWKIIEVELDPGVITRHMFGWSPTTRKWQISSKILSEADDHIQTKSRKYWKEGDQAGKLSFEGKDMLMQFLHIWGRSEAEISAVISKI